MLDTKSIAQELEAIDLSAIDIEDEHETQSPLLWYCLLRARAAFVSAHGRHAGADNALADADAQWLLTHAQAIATRGGSADLAARVTLDHARELTRACEVELHNIAAIMGGVASQEAVKIITNKFVPLNHTYVFNGIAGFAGAYEL